MRPGRHARAVIAALVLLGMPADVPGRPSGGGAAALPPAGHR
jgi:hypothetical protein